jgi:hypothetical protein
MGNLIRGGRKLIMKITELSIKKFAIELLEKTGHQYFYAFASKLYGGKRS